MRTILSRLCVLLALSFVALPVLGDHHEDDKPKKKQKGQDKADKADKEDKGSGLRGAYAIMVKECNLSESQQVQLKQVVADHAQREKEWMEANGDKLKELRTAMSEARKAKDKDKQAELKKEAGELEQARRDRHAAKMEAVHGVLSDEQKQQWAAFQMYTGQMRAFKKANLTEAQQDEVRALCVTAAGKTTDGDSKAQSAAVKQLRQQIIDEVLTADQKEAFKPKPKAEKEPREKRQKAEKAPKQKKNKDAEGDMDDEL